RRRIVRLLGTRGRRSVLLVRACRRSRRSLVRASRRSLAAGVRRLLGRAARAGAHVQGAEGVRTRDAVHREISPLLEVPYAIRGLLTVVAVLFERFEERVPGIEHTLQFLHLVALRTVLQDPVGLRGTRLGGALPGDSDLLRHARGLRGRTA